MAQVTNELYRYAVSKSFVDGKLSFKRDGKMEKAMQDLISH